MSRIREGSAPLTRSAADVATDLIRTAILDGRLAPGERLTEDRLAVDLGISRTPVREALRVLQTEGLVDWAPYAGSTVRTYELHDLSDMYGLRALLEGYAARRAATRITPADVERLRESCTRFEALGAASEETLQALVDENLMFHNVVLDAAGSDRLSELVRKVVELPLVYKSYVWYSPSQKRRSEQAHFQLTAALANRDPDQAELVMRAHVYEARDVLVEHVKAEAESQAEGVSDHE